jgi:hypothetical protein
MRPIIKDKPRNNKASTWYRKVRRINKQRIKKGLEPLNYKEIFNDYDYCDYILDLRYSKNKKQTASTVQIATPHQSTATPPPLPKQPSIQFDQETTKQNKINLTLIKEEPTIDMNVPVQPYDDGGSNFFNVSEITIQDTIEELPPSFEAMSNIAQFTGGTITKAEIEELIRKELQSSFEKIVREEFPLIAEKIIRKEIEKVLSEP